MLFPFFFLAYLSEKENGSMNSVLYVPLDDRPVNLDDVIKLGQACGLKLITPNAAHIRNRIDSQKTASGNQIVSTSSPTFGNPANIRQFILDHAASVDGFIISIDMLVYGGLIGSRRLRDNGGGTYPNYDPTATHLLDVIRQIKQMHPSKPVYVLDTIMRLATTSFTEGLSYKAYTESRSFMGEERYPYTSFEDILNGYDKNAIGEHFGNTINFNKTDYYNTRQHKFKTNYYVLEQLTRLGYIDFLVIGVDDAKTKGVQKNEISFVENFIANSLGGDRNGQNPDKAVILPDADGLGHSLVARMANQLLRGGNKTRISVLYYGPDGSTITDPYEYMNVDQNIRYHIDVVGGQYATSSPNIELIAITDASQISSAVSRIHANGTNRIATVVVNFSGSTVQNVVSEALLASQYTGCILGYCAWNTTGNRIGISLGMGQARYAFLVTETQTAALNAAVNAHGSLLFKRFLKDYYYKTDVIADIRKACDDHSLYTNVVANQGMNMTLYLNHGDYQTILALMRSRMQAAMTMLKAKSAFLIDDCATACNVKQICGSNWTFADYAGGSLAYTNPNFIWLRPNEITLDPVITLS